MSTEIVLILLSVGVVLVLLGAALLLWEANTTVAAVYRAAIHEAAKRSSDGVVWLQSSEGVAFRKTMVQRAYEVLPSTFGPVPFKLFVTAERFQQLVQLAFDYTVRLTTRLELPPTTK